MWHSQKLRGASPRHFGFPKWLGELPRRIWGSEVAEWPFGDPQKAFGEVFRSVCEKPTLSAGRRMSEVRPGLFSMSSLADQGRYLRISDAIASLRAYNSQHFQTTENVRSSRPASCLSLGKTQGASRRSGRGHYRSSESVGLHAQSESAASEALR